MDKEERAEARAEKKEEKRLEDEAEALKQDQAKDDKIKMLEDASNLLLDLVKRVEVLEGLPEIAKLVKKHGV